MAVYQMHTDSERSSDISVEGVSTRPGEHGVNRAMTASPQTGRPSRTTSPVIFNPYYTGRPRTPTTANKGFTVDRNEIIRQKKEFSRPTSPEIERRKTPVPIHIEENVRSSSPQTPERRRHDGEAGMQIERPRSALHRGDFRERDAPEGPEGKIGSAARIQDTTPLFATSPVVPWDSRFPASALHHGSIYRSEPAPNGIPIPVQRTRAPSYSLASGFVYRPPTSPLAQSSRPDTPDQSSRMRSRSPDKSRRHTFSPTYMHDYSSRIGMSPPGSMHKGVPTLRSERTFPCQALQPDRPRVYRTSASLPQSPMGHSRRISLSDSPLHHAPMVGSYEESILRGRMSTTPSKPLNFVAQIGVLGKGNCKPSLRCPSHVSIPFPAVFYSYGSGSKVNPTSDQPSPYVGLIDLENGLQSKETSERRRKQNVQSAMSPSGSRATSRNREESMTPDEQQQQQRRHQKQSRRSGSPRAPSGGCYRIPPVGQLQIVLKNPNKTAVKLFLVPYDLTDMPPNTKTFLRQRSYSAGPIIDMPLSSRKNLGTDRPEAGINPSGDPRDKPILRYLIHLNICCPSKGRFYLYGSMRVVFANRVPDGKEKLRNEVQMPEPRFSAYKSERLPMESGTTNAPAAETSWARRRSAMMQLDPHQLFPPIREDQWASPSPFSLTGISSPPPPIRSSSKDLGRDNVSPFHVLPTLNSRPQSHHAFDDDDRDEEGYGMDIDSPARQTSSSRSTQMQMQSPTSPIPTTTIYPSSSSRPQNFYTPQKQQQQQRPTISPFSPFPPSAFTGASAFGISSSSSTYSPYAPAPASVPGPALSPAPRRDHFNISMNRDFPPPGVDGEAAMAFPSAPAANVVSHNGHDRNVTGNGTGTSTNISSNSTRISTSGGVLRPPRSHARKASASSSLLLERGLRGLNVVVEQQRQTGNGDRNRIAAEGVRSDEEEPIWEDLLFEQDREEGHHHRDQ